MGTSKKLFSKDNGVPGPDYYNLRRFADDLNMYAINLCYLKNPTDKEIYKLEQEIDNTCDYINMQSNTIDSYVNKKLIKNK